MSPLTFKKFRCASQSDEDSLKVELFQDVGGRICAWFLGPVRSGAAGIKIPYLARSKGVPASVAVLRAVDEAKAAGLTVSIVDPDDLWDRVWHA